MEGNFKLTVLGARGSIPVSGSRFNEFGVATSSYMIEAGKEVIFLDAGTGIINSPSIDEDRNITILLSHPHLDHIIGLPFFPELSKKDRHIEFYGKEAGGKSISHQIERAFSQPYWPLTIIEYPSNFHYRNMELPMTLGEGDEKIEITGIDLRHPGGNLGFRIEYKGKSIVYLTDYEMTDGPEENVIEFSKGADILLCDAQYSDEEYSTKKGFGHSTFGDAEKLFDAAGARQMLLIHHDPKRDDEELLKEEEKIGRDNIRFAREGETIEI